MGTLEHTMSSSKVLCLFVLYVAASVDGFTLQNNDSFSATNRSFFEEFEEEARKKKKDKFLLPIVFGALVVKSIVLPLAFKAMAVMSSIAVLLSTMSLIISSIIGYAKVAYKHPPPPSLRVVHVNEGPWAKEDDAKKGFMPTMITTDGMDYEQSAPQETIYYGSH